MDETAETKIVDIPARESRGGKRGAVVKTYGSAMKNIRKTGQVIFISAHFGKGSVSASTRVKKPAIIRIDSSIINGRDP